MLFSQVKQHFKGVANSYSAIHDIHKYLARTEGGGLQARAEAEMADLLVEVSSTLGHLANEHVKSHHNPEQATIAHWLPNLKLQGLTWIILVCQIGRGPGPTQLCTLSSCAQLHVPIAACALKICWRPAYTVSSKVEHRAAFMC